MRRVAVTGPNGFLGSYLMEEFQKHEVGVIGLNRATCDFSDRNTVAAMLNGIDVVVHTAALVNIERCQNEPTEAMASNWKLTQNLVRCLPEKCRFIYISTDSIYSGIGPHSEGSATENPLNVYAVSKYMGEAEAKKAPNHLILRTSMYGASKNPDKIATSLADNLIKAFKSGNKVPLFTDVFFSPLHIKTLSKIIHQVSSANVTGTFNLGAYTGMSKLKFGLELANILGLSATYAMPVSSKDIAGRIIRPLDTRLNCGAFYRYFNIILPAMEQDMLNLKGDRWLT